MECTTEQTIAQEAARDGCESPLLNSLYERDLRLVDDHALLVEL
jgi:hypothetical protein